MTVEAISDSAMMIGDVGEFFLSNEDWDAEFTSTRASLQVQNIIVNIFPRSR